MGIMHRDPLICVCTDPAALWTQALALWQADTVPGAHNYAHNPMGMHYVHNYGYQALCLMAIMHCA